MTDYFMWKHTIKLIKNYTFTRTKYDTTGIIKTPPSWSVIPSNCSKTFLPKSLELLSPSRQLNEKTDEPC